MRCVQPQTALIEPTRSNNMCVGLCMCFALAALCRQPTQTQGSLHGGPGSTLDAGLHLFCGYGVGHHPLWARPLAAVPGGGLPACLVCCCGHLVYARKPKVFAGAGRHRGSRTSEERDSCAHTHTHTLCCFQTNKHGRLSSPSCSLFGMQIRDVALSERDSSQCVQTSTGITHGLSILHLRCVGLLLCIFILQVLQRMAAINKRRRLQPIKLIPHQGHHHHLATTPPPPPADDDGGVSQQLHSHSPEVSSAQQADMGWQHAHGHHSQQHHAAAIHELEAPQRHRGGGHGGSSSSSGGVRASSSSGGAGGGRGHSSSSSSQRGSGRGRGVSGAGRQHQQEQQWKQQQRQCCKSSFAATRMLLQPPLRRRFLPLLVAWLGLCGGWYSTVRVPCVLMC